jgi:hypothetical protein
MSVNTELRQLAELRAKYERLRAAVRRLLDVQDHPTFARGEQEAVAAVEAELDDEQ